MFGDLVSQRNKHISKCRRIVCSDTQRMTDTVFSMHCVIDEVLKMFRTFKYYIFPKILSFFYQCLNKISMEPSLKPEQRNYE